MKSVTGLNPGQQYTFEVKAQNGDSALTAYSSQASKYTLANAPSAPTVAAVSTTSLSVDVNTNGNNGAVTYAIHETTQDKYVQSDGTLGASAVYAVDQTWGVKSVTGLNPGQQYTFEVKAQNGDSVLTAYSSQASKYTLAAAPSAPTVAAVSSTSLSVDVNPNGNHSSVIYAIREAGGQFVQTNGTLGATAHWQTDAAWGTKTVSSLSVNQQYTFDVQAKNGDGTTTAYSGTASKYTLAIVPAAPTVGNPTAATLDVTVNANGNPSSVTFAIHEAGGQFIQADGTLGASAVWQTASTWATITVIGLAGNTTYTFDVKARNGENVETAYGSSAGGSTLSLSKPVLITPTFASIVTNGATLGATITTNGGAAVTSRGTVWNTTGDPVTENGAAEGGTADGAFSHARTGMPEGTLIYFRGYAVNSEGTGYSPSTNFWTTPKAPALSAANAITNVSFSANWSAATGATNYLLDASTSATFASFVDGYSSRVAGNATTFSVTGLTAGVTYYWRVRAQNSGGISVDSSTNTTLTIPNAPVASAYSSATPSSFSANWAAASGATSYRLDVSTVNNFASFVSGWSNVDVGNVTTYSVNSSLSAGTVYYYRLRSANASGSSSNSATITAYTLSAEPAGHASSFAAAPASTSSINLTWTAASGPPSGYLILQRTGAAPTGVPADGNAYTAGNTIGDATVAAVITSGATESTTISGLSAATAYYFTIVPYNWNGANSETYNYRTQATIPSANATTVYAEPGTQATSITFDTVAITGMTVQWSNGNGANRLVVARAGGAVNADPSDQNSYSANAAFASGSQIGTGNYVVYSGSGTSVTVSALSADTVYHYRVYEFNGSGVTANYNVNTASGNPANRTTMANEPTVNTTSASITGVGATGFTISWSGGNGANAIVLVKASGAVDSAPVDQTTYTANAAFSSGTQIGTGNYVVYKGSGSSVDVTGLSAATTYHVAVYQYNGSSAGAENYFTTGPATANSTTLSAEPTTQASGINFTSLGKSTITVNWTSGNGANRIVVAKEAAAVDSHPVDGTGYTANSVFGSGTQLGTGNYVVYGGSGSSVAVTGLKTNTTYHFRVYEYNGSGATLNYMTNTATANPASQATWDLEPGISQGGGLSQTATVGSNPGTQTLTITNIGRSQLSFALSTNASWLSLSAVSGGPLSAGGTAGFTVTYNVAGLSAGTSNATITVTSTGSGANAATNSPVTIPVTLTLSAINDPASASATANGKEMINLAWTPHGSYGTVMILRKTSAITTDPSPNTSYSEGNTIDGATVIYKGTATTREHVVPQGSANYYKFYSVNNNHYSAGITANTTLGSYLTGTSVETFSYTNTGTLATSGQGNGGQGWAGAWTGDTGDFSINSGSFANQANYPNGSGNKVKVTPPDSGSKAVFRALDQTYKDGRIYFGYVMNYQYEGANKYEGLSLFYDTSSEKLFVGEIGAQDQQLGIDGTGSSRALTKGTGNDYIIIGYYDWVNGQAKARAYKIGTDTVPTDEETSWDVTVSKSSNTVGWVNTIRLASGVSSGSGTPGDTYFDEIRVATNWAGILGITPQQPSLAVGPTSISNTVMLGSSLSTYVFGVTNAGGGTLLYTNYITHGSGWSGASVAPANSSLGAAASRSDTVTVSSAGLSAGNYYATNRVAGNQTNSAALVSIVMTVTNIPSVTSESATAEGAEMIRLGWTPPSGLQVLIVHRGTNAPTGPSQNTSYSVGNSIGSDGSMVIYKGSATALEHIVKPGSVNHYGFYAINNNHYSPVASASATVSSYRSGEIVEPMAYTNGLAMNTSGTGNGGQGWSAAWNGSDLANWTVNSGSFSQQANYPTNAGNKLTANATSAQREIFRGFSQARTGGKIYVSFILNYASDAWAGLSLYDGATEKLFFGEASGTANQLGISKQGGTYAWGNSLSAGPGNDYIVVGAFDFGTGEAKVKSYKIGTDTVPVTEPGDWSATLTGVSISSIDGIRLAAGSGAGVVYMDEVRVATNWNELLNVTYTTPVLAVAPGSVSYSTTLGINPAEETFTVSNVGGGGGNLDYTNIVTYSPAGSWLSIAQSTGRLAASSSQIHTASVNVASLAAGTYYATNTIYAGAGGTQKVSFVLAVGAPGSQVGPTTLYVTSSYGVVSSVAPYPNFFVTNGGSGAVNLNFSNSVSYSGAAGWLTLGSVTGSVASGAVFTNTATANPGALNPGSYSATITVNGNQTNTAPTVTVNLTVVGYRVGEIYDPFTNSVAAVFTNQNGGTGWTNMWRIVPPGALGISSGNLNAPANYPVPQGNSITGNPNSAEIQAFRGFRAFNSGRIYVSVLIKAENPIASSFAGVSLMSGSVEQLFIGKRWSSGQFGVEAPNSSGSAKDSNFNFGNGTYLLVGMYDFDQDFFRGQIYNSSDSVSLIEPDSWQVSNTLSTAIGMVDGIRLAGKDCGTSLIFDEVRVSPTWEELINSSPNEPTVQASLMRFADVTTNSMNVSWNSGSGVGRIVVARQGSPVDWAPTDGNGYTANSDWSIAPDQGSGNRVIYNGSGTNLSLVALGEATNYFFKVFEYNGTGESANYLTDGNVLNSNRWTLVSESAGQPYGFSVGPVSSSVMTGLWSAANGTPSPDGYLIIRRADATPTSAPQDGVAYAAGDTLGDGVVAAVLGSGTANGTLFYALQDCQTYTYALYSFRRLSASDDTINYLTSSPATASGATLCTEPDAQASNIVFGVVTTNSIQLSWQNGNGASRIVVARGTNAISIMPVDQTAYTANANYGSGSQVGSVGQYVVYNGTGETVNVTGLSPNVDYSFRIFEYNGVGGAANYMTNTANNNPRSTRTASFGLVEDMFEDGDSNLSGNGQGTGWTNNWQTKDGLVSTSAGSFPAFKNYPADTGNYKGYLNSVTKRSAYRQFPPRTSGKIYVAMKLNIGNQNQSGYFGINLLNGSGTTGFFGKASGVVGGLLSLDQNAVQSTTPLHTNTTYTLLAGSGNDYLMVGMYDFEQHIFRVKAYTTNVFSHVDPTREMNWSAEMTNVNISAIDGIEVIGENLGDCYFDHIRVGSTWDEVMLGRAPGHQFTGPTPELIYIGTNYSGSAIGGPVVTNLTDAELKSSTLIDFAIRWSDTDGVFLTNLTSSITNIGSPVGRVNPNWDPLSVGAATNEFNLDRFFTNFYGYNGSTVVTTYQRSAFNVTNIDFTVQYFVTVSAEDNPISSGTDPSPNGGDAVPKARAITINTPMRFYVSDDDTNPPVAGSVPLVVFTNSANAPYQSVGDLRRYFVTDGGLTSVGFSASINYYDDYSGLKRSSSGAVESNMSVTVQNLITNNVSGYDAAKSTANGQLTTATSYWNFASSLFTYDQVGSMYGAGGADALITADIPDADDDRVNDEAWASNAVLGYLRVVDDDDTPPEAANINFGGGASRPFYVLTNGVALGTGNGTVRETYARQSGSGAASVFALTDGDLASADGVGLQFAFGAQDASGIGRGTSGDTNTIMSFSIGSGILPDVITGWNDSLSTALNGAQVQTNAFNLSSGLFSESVITQLMAVTGALGTGSNAVFVTIPDNDRDRPFDQKLLVSEPVGYLRVFDDDVTGPHIGVVSVSSLPGSATLLASSFETGESWPETAMTGSWSHTDSYGTWHAEGALYTSLEPKASGTHRIGLLTNLVDNPYIQLPAVFNPGRIFLYAARSSEGSGEALLKVESWDGAGWLDHGSQAITGASYQAMSWDLDITGSTTLRVMRVDTTANREEVFVDDVVVSALSEWVSTNQLALSWNEAVDDYSGVSEYRFAAPAMTSRVLSAMTEGASVSATSQVSDLTGQQGVLTGYVAAVDNDNDRSDDRAMGPVVPVVIRVDTNPPIQISAESFQAALGDDDTSQIKLNWTNSPDEYIAAGHRVADNTPLSPWSTYRIFYTQDSGSDPTKDSSYWDANDYPDLAAVGTEEVTLQNLAAGASYRISIAGVDRAGNVGPLSAVRPIQLNIYGVTNAFVDGNQNVVIQWNGLDSGLYDVIYADSTGFSSVVDSMWTLAKTVAGTQFVDEGGVNEEAGTTRVHPAQLPYRTLRFYRIASLNQWKPTAAAAGSASTQIVVAVKSSLTNGYNYIGLGMRPFLNTLEGVLGTNRLPAADVLSGSARVNVFTPSLSGAADSNTWWLSSLGWTYETNSSISANNQEFPTPNQGFNLWVPANTSVLMVGMVPWTEHPTISVATGAYYVMSMNTPRPTKFSELNIHQQMKRNNNVILADEVRILRRGGGPFEAPKARIYVNGSGVISFAGTSPGGAAADFPIEVDDAIILRTDRGSSAITWAPPLVFSPPRRQITNSLSTAPVVSLRDATLVTETSVTLRAVVNPVRLATEAWFSYGTTTNYGSVTAKTSMPATNAPINISIPVENLQPNSIYYIKIVATNSGGMSRGGSGAFLTSGTCTSDVPSAPTVTASDGSLTAYVALSWPDVADEHGYRISRHTVSNSSAASAIASVSANVTTYNDTTALPGQQYYYWIKATNCAGSSAFGIGDGGYRKLATVTEAAASDGAYTDRVVVTWTDLSGETGYTIWRYSSDNSGSATMIGSVAADVITYSDTGTGLGQVNYYWVRATNSTSASMGDFQLNGAPGSRAVAAPPALVSPTVSSITITGATLGATVSTDGGSAVLSRGTVWDLTTPPTAYSLAEGGSSLGAFSHPRVSLPSGSLIYYRGWASNAIGKGYSAVDSFWTIPLAPAIGSSTAIGASQFTISWNVSTGASNYLVDVSASSAFGSFVTGYASRVVGNVTSLVVTGVSPSVTNYWRVRAENSGGVSVSSATGSVVTLVAAPTTQASALSFSAVGGNSATIGWTSGNGSYRLAVVKAAAAVDSHPVNGTAYSANSAFGSGSQLGSGNYVVFSGSGSSVTLSGLSSNTAYYVRVYEFNGAGSLLNYMTNSATGNPGSFVTLGGSPVLAVTPLAVSFCATLGSNPSPATASVVISNSGGSTLIFTNSQTYGSNASGWLYTSLTNGSTLAMTSVVQSIGALCSTFTNAGTFVATNRITGNQANGAQEIVVTLDVTNIPGPTAATATASGAEFVALNWTPVGGRSVMIVYRQTNAPSSDPVNGTTYSVGDLIGSDGSKVVYVGSGSSFEQVVAAGVTNHFYRFYSINNNRYSPPVSANASTLVYPVGSVVESFAYTNGSTLAGLAGGVGWLGSWSNASSSTSISNFYINSVSLPTWANYPVSAGGKVVVPNQVAGNFKAQRLIPQMTAGKIFLGFMLNAASLGSNAWAGMSLIDSGYAEKLFIGQRSLSQFGLATYGGAGDAVGTNVLFAGSNYVVILRHDFNTAVTSAKVYPAGGTVVPASEPSLWDCSVSNNVLSGLSGVWMNCGNSGDTYFDEIRVATNWTQLVTGP